MDVRVGLCESGIAGKHLGQLAPQDHGHEGVIDGPEQHAAHKAEADQGGPAIVQFVRVMRFRFRHW